MLFAQNLTVSFITRDLFKDVTFSISDGERVALVGSNGAGKTTLMRLLAQEDQPTSGTAGYRGGTMGYLKQESGFDPNNTLVEELWTAFTEARAIKLRLQELEATLANAANDPTINATVLIAEQVNLYHRFELLDGHGVAGRIDRVTVGLGFKPSDRTKLCAEFSGGWRMRISLAKALVRRPDHMLLDEPTNHLDADARAFLAKELVEYKGTLVLITHDHLFLDKVVNRVLEVSDTGVASYTGNFTKYVQQKEKRLILQEQAAGRQEREIAKQEVFIERFRASATKATAAASREKQLAKVVRIAHTKGEDRARFTITALGRVEQRVLVLQSISHAYDDNLVLIDVNLTVERQQKVVLVGPNGGGKSTLLRIAAGQLQPMEGTVTWAEHAKFGYYEQHQDEALDLNRTVMEEVQAAAGAAHEVNLRNILGKFLFKGDDVFKPISVLSGGERSRVALAKFLIQPTNVLLLDEPTNHLDKATRESLIKALQSYDGTILCASHDQAILDTIATHVYEVRGGECIPTHLAAQPMPVKQPARRK